jgi:hypothetical protein
MKGIIGLYSASIVAFTLFNRGVEVYRPSQSFHKSGMDYGKIKQAHKKNKRAKSFKRKRK